MGKRQNSARWTSSCYLIGKLNPTSYPDIFCFHSFSCFAVYEMWNATLPTASWSLRSFRDITCRTGKKHPGNLAVGVHRDLDVWANYSDLSRRLGISPPKWWFSREYFHQNILNSGLRCTDVHCTLYCHLPSLKLAANAPENGWLEDDRFLLGVMAYF